MHTRGATSLILCAYEQYYANLIKKNQVYTHKDCIHYQNGFCKLNMIEVTPDGSVCPGFTLRSTPGKKEETIIANQDASSYGFPGLLVSKRGYRIGRRRRGRRGRR